MEAKRLLLVSLLALSIVGAVTSETHVASSSGATIVSVDPSLKSAPVGTYFTIRIKVSDVSNLSSWFFTLYTDGMILYTNETLIEEGPFLSNYGQYATLMTVNQEGFLWHVGCHIVGAGSVDGTGTIARITFLVKKKGWTPLSFFATSLLDPDLVPIPHTARNGYFSNIRDVRLWDIVAYPTTVSVGELVFINVTVMNQGNKTETFDIAAYYNTTAIGSQTVTSLTPFTLKTLIITWNTTGVADGTYTISANASILEGEFDTDNNRLVDGDVTLTLKPAAYFTYSPAYPLVGENVTFDASASFDPDGNITGYEWDFGDNTADTGMIVNHTYTSAGYYMVNLTVTDNANLTDTELQSIAIGKPNASFTFTPDFPIVGETVTFNASLSTPRGGFIVNYTWNFGDGNITTVAEPTVTHVYTDSGDYTVILTVIDSEGMWDTESKSIAVRSVMAPVAAFIRTPDSPLVGENVTFDASASFDPDGNITSYEWDFGDNTADTGMIVNHTYATTGEFNVTLTVTDDDALTDTIWAIVTVRDYPVAVFTYSPADPIVGETVTFNASLSTPRGGFIVNYTWNFGDGNITTVAEPTVTHVYTDSGDYTVILTVIDSEDLTDTETKTITVQEAPSEALSDIIVYVAVAVVIIVIVAAVIYYVKTRKPS